MTALFVHGNPETPVVWGPLLAQLDRSDATALQLPGFGVQAPAGFDATKDAYVDWLIAELERAERPIDVVGHDWGGGFVLRAACLRPDLIRSWVSDVGGMLSPDFVWHDLALVWQTPGAGEQFFADMGALPALERAQGLETVGIPAAEARAFADALDDEMARCVLSLYRSAAQPAMNAWAHDAEAAGARPGLLLAPTADPYTGGSGPATAVAARIGCRIETLPGLGHWWMLEDPGAGARVLERFWATLDDLA